LLFDDEEEEEEDSIDDRPLTTLEEVVARRAEDNDLLFDTEEGPVAVVPLSTTSKARLTISNTSWMLFVLEPVLLGGYSRRVSSPPTTPNIGAVIIRDVNGN
jgi:hypothetical protein